jgi:hypothetical protein
VFAHRSVHVVERDFVRQDSVAKTQPEKVVILDRVEPPTIEIREEIPGDLHALGKAAMTRVLFKLREPSRTNLRCLNSREFHEFDEEDMSEDGGGKSWVMIRETRTKRRDHVLDLGISFDEWPHSGS